MITVLIRQNRISSFTKKTIAFLLVTCLYLFTQLSFAAIVPLSKEQAFQLALYTHSSQQITLQWQIAPGYYLYAKKIHVTLSPQLPMQMELPATKLTDAQHNAVYSNQLIVPISLPETFKSLRMQISYQGCSRDGFCYPPISENFLLNLATGQVVREASDNSVSIQSLLTQQNEVHALLKTSYLPLTLLLFLGLGLLLAFTPCVLPMFPILMSIIAGQQHQLTWKRSLFLSVSYVLGMAVAYAGIGFTAAYLGRSLQVALEKPVYIVSASLIFILLAFSLFGFYELRLPRCLQNRMTQTNHYLKGGTHLGVFMMGVLSTLIVSPCITAPLGGVLLFIAETGHLLVGTLALFVMGIGIGIPLLLLGVSQGKWRMKNGHWMETIKYIFGFVMLGMAAWLLSRIISLTNIILLSGSLLILIAIGHKLFCSDRKRYLSWVTGLSGMLILVGGINLDSISLLPNRTETSAPQSFVLVHNVHELKQQLYLARNANQPVILDFYADWCTSCVAMDKNVFGVEAVQQSLKNYIVLRADLSANTHADEALLKQFNVIAPPTILFFDAHGQEINTQRVIGEVSAKEFLQRLHTTISKT